MKNYTKVPAPKGLPAWPAAMLGLSAERPRGVSGAGGRVSLACAAVGAIDRESERGEESARLLTQSWTRTGVDARRTRDIDLLVSRVSPHLYMPAAFTPQSGYLASRRNTGENRALRSWANTSNTRSATQHIGLHHGNDRLRLVT